MPSFSSVGQASDHCPPVTGAAAVPSVVPVGELPAWTANPTIGESPSADPAAPANVGRAKGTPAPGVGEVRVSVGGWTLMRNVMGALSPLAVGPDCPATAVY